MASTVIWYSGQAFRSELLASAVVPVDAVFALRRFMIACRSVPETRLMS